MSETVDRCHYRRKTNSKIKQNLFQTFKSIELGLQDDTCDLPWLFKARSTVIYTEDFDPEERLRAAFCFKIKERGKMVSSNSWFEDYHSCVMSRIITGDPYHPTLAEFKYLKEKPLNFLVIGKPGLNTETIGLHIAELWGSVFISPSVAMSLTLPHLLDKKYINKLKEGGQLPVDELLKAVDFMRSSAEAKSQGYVLAGLPLSTHSFSKFYIEEQMEFIFKNSNRPNIIVYLTCPNTDVILLNKEGNVVSMQRKNMYHIRHLIDGEKVLLQRLDKQSANLERDPTSSETYLLNEFYNFIDEDKTHFFIRSSKMLNEAILNDYVEKISPILDRYVLQYDSQCVFKVDGRRTTVEALESIREKLNLLCLIPPCRPKPIFDSPLIGDSKDDKLKSLSWNSILSYEEQDKEIVVDYEIEDLQNKLNDENEQENVSELDGEDVQEDFRENEDYEEKRVDETVSLTQYRDLEIQEAFEKIKSNCAPQGFNLRESNYSILCPVEIHRGHICDGNIEFACAFAGKLFLFSSLLAIKKFIKNPKRYALAPPPSTRKIAVLGPPMTGKSTVAHSLSSFFGLQVISMRRLIEKVYQSSMRKIEGIIFKIYTKPLESLQRDEDEAWKKSEEERALKISDWIKDQLPLICKRLEFSSFIADHLTPITGNLEQEVLEKSEETIADQAFLLPRSSFHDLLDNFNINTKKIDFEVDFGKTFTQLYKNPQPDLEICNRTFTFQEASDVLSSLKDDFSTRGLRCFDNIDECRDFLIDPLKLACYLPENLRQPFSEAPSINYDDERLNSRPDNIGIHTAFGFLSMNIEKLVDALEEEILEIEAEKNLNLRLSTDLQLGGWILDNLPINDSFWTEIISRFLLPDDLICRVVDGNNVEAAKNQFLKVEPFKSFRSYYDPKTVGGPRSIQVPIPDEEGEKIYCERPFITSNTSEINSQCDWQSTKMRSRSSSMKEDMGIRKFFIPFDSIPNYKGSLNPFDLFNHEMNYVEVNFRSNHEFLSKCFQDITSPSKLSGKIEKIEKTTTSDNEQAFQIEKINPEENSKTFVFKNVTGTMSSSLKLEQSETGSMDPNVEHELSKEQSQASTAITNEIVDQTTSKYSDECNYLMPGNEQDGITKNLELENEHDGQRMRIKKEENIDQNHYKLNEKSIEDILSVDSLDWSNPQEIHLTREANSLLRWDMSNSDLSLSSSEFDYDLRNNLKGHGDEERTPSISSEMDRQFHGFYKSGSSMIQVQPQQIKNLGNVSEHHIVEEPFKMSGDFLFKYKTVTQKIHGDEMKIPEVGFKNDVELRFYRNIVTKKYNFLNAIETLIKQDDELDKVFEYLQNRFRTQQPVDTTCNLTSEETLATNSSVALKREKGKTRLPTIQELGGPVVSAQKDESSFPSTGSSDKYIASTESQGVVDWYISDDVIFFMKQNSKLPKTAMDGTEILKTDETVLRSANQETSCLNRLRSTGNPCIWKSRDNAGKRLQKIYSHQLKSSTDSDLIELNEIILSGGKGMESNKLKSVGSIIYETDKKFEEISEKPDDEIGREGRGSVLSKKSIQITSVAGERDVDLKDFYNQQRMSQSQVLYSKWLLPNVPAENWEKFLTFINLIYSYTSPPDGNSRPLEEKLSPEKRASNSIKEESLEDSCLTPQEDNSCTTKYSSLLDAITVFSKLEVDLPIPQNQFNTCLDVALNCLTQGKTIEEIYSFDQHSCLGSNEKLTAKSLDSIFGSDTFKQIYRCHSDGNRESKSGNLYLPTSLRNSEQLVSGSNETIEILLNPNVIHSVEDDLQLPARAIIDETVGKNLIGFNSDFLRTVPRAILHLVDITKKSQKVSGKNKVEMEHVVSYRSIVNKNNDKEALNNEDLHFSSLEKIIGLRKASEIVFNETDIDACILPFYSPKISSMNEIESDFEEFVKIYVRTIELPAKFQLFLNSLTSSIRQWSRDWDVFKADNFVEMNSLNLIEQNFEPEFNNKSAFLDILISKLLSSQGPKTIQNIPEEENLIKTLSSNDIDEAANDFIHNISPATGFTSEPVGDSDEGIILPDGSSDIYPFCPVTYKEKGKLFTANGTFSAIFKDELFSFASESDRTQFLDFPDNFAVQPTSDYQVPPLKICVISNVYCDTNKHLAREIADHFNLQCVSFSREITRLLLKKSSKPVGLINENLTNLEMFDFGEILFEGDATYLEKLNYLRDYLNLEGSLSDDDLKMIVDHFFDTQTGITVYDFPVSVEDLECIVKEKITPSVVIYIDIEKEKKEKVALFENKVKDQQLLNYGSRLRKLIKSEHIKYVLWDLSRTKLFNIVLRQSLKKRRDKKFFLERLKRTFPQTLVDSILKQDGNTNSDSKDLEQEEVFKLKKTLAAENIMNPPTVQRKIIDEFKNYLLEKEKEISDEVEIFNSKTQTRSYKFEDGGISDTSIATEYNEDDSSSFKIKDTSGDELQDDEIDDENLDDEIGFETKLHRRPLAVMDFSNLPKGEDKYLQPFESVYYLPPDYEVNKDDYLTSPSNESSEWMGKEATDSITSREITSSLNINSEFLSSKKSRKIALQFGAHNISEEFIMNVYEMFRNEYPPPKSCVKKLKPINFEDTILSLKNYYNKEVNNINGIKDFCLKHKIPFINHKITCSLKRLLEDIKCVTRWPNIFEKCFVVTHETAMQLLNDGYYFFSKFGRWCPVGVLEKGLPVQQKYSEEIMKKLVFPVIHKKYIYFIHTESSLSKFISSPLKYLEQQPYLTMFPVKIAVIGAPKTGKTKLIDYIGRMYGLQVIRIDSAINYVCSEMHWTDLAQKIHECLKKGNLLLSDLLVQALYTYLLSPECINRGWILDGFPLTKDDVMAMRKCDLIPHVTICIETNKFWENTVLNKLHEERIFIESKNDGIFSPEDFKKKDRNVTESMFRVREADDEFHDEDKLFYKYIRPVSFVKYEIWKWRQNRNKHEEMISAINEIWGNTLEILWKNNYLKMTARILDFLKICLFAFQEYTLNLYQGLPASVFFLNLSEEEFEMHKSQFKECCPCCWYYTKIYHRCPSMKFRNMTSGLFQYGNHIYWICLEHIESFLSNATLYLDHYSHLFEENYPQKLTIGEKIIQDYFDLQFNGKCITCYLKNLPKIFLNQGSPKYALSLKNKKIYLFCQESCMLNMMMKPQDYSKIKPFDQNENLPNFFKRNSQELFTTEYFEQSVLTDLLCSALTRVAKTRPRIFEINNEISSCTHLALILKAYSNDIDEKQSQLNKKMLANFENYSHTIHIICSFIDKLACSLNIANLVETEGSEIQSHYFFERLVPFLTADKIENPERSTRK